jgi:ADP-ribosylglycohydrolase
MIGALAADAVAMPVHWYYDTAALDRDYGELDGYAAPKNPHPDSILWRSRYRARNNKGEILHDQAKFWGQRDVHYHQFLKRGENTVNYQLGLELYRLVRESGRYDPDAWLQRYIDCLRQPGWHRDTYLEEYHRAFFDNLARGLAPRDCGIDDLHIGGISQIPCLLAALAAIGVDQLDARLDCVATHVALTHRNTHAARAAAQLTRLLHAIEGGAGLEEALEQSDDPALDPAAFLTWSRFPDRVVVGRQLTPACYLPESFTASAYLAWKYREDFSAGILANARCGGDSCHRGAVVGALLGARQEIPDKWSQGLISAADLPLP